jgi:hypothetical protein
MKYGVLLTNHSWPPPPETGQTILKYFQRVLSRIAQPFKAGLAEAQHKSPGRDERKVLPSQKGLGVLADENPRLKPWAIFRSRRDERGGAKLFHLFDDKLKFI